VDKLRALSYVKPFQGDNTALSGMSNAAAAKIISDAKNGAVTRCWSAYRPWLIALPPKREIITEAGLETRGTIAAWNDKCEHYVPLHWGEVGPLSKVLSTKLLTRCRQAGRFFSGSQRLF
jgi:hypothetical protein